MAAAAACPLELLASVASPSRRGRGTVSLKSSLGFCPPQRGYSPVKPTIDVVISPEETAEPLCAAPADASLQEEKMQGDCLEETCREAIRRLQSLEEEVAELRLTCQQSGDAINCLVDDSESADLRCQVEGEASETVAVYPVALLEALDRCSEDVNREDLLRQTRHRLDSLEVERARLLDHVAAAADAIARVASLCRQMDECFDGETDTM